MVGSQGMGVSMAGSIMSFLVLDSMGINGSSLVNHSLLMVIVIVMLMMRNLMVGMLGLLVLNKGFESEFVMTFMLVVSVVRVMDSVCVMSLVRVQLTIVMLARVSIETVTMAVGIAVVHTVRVLGVVQLGGVLVAVPLRVAVMADGLVLIGGVLVGVVTGRLVAGESLVSLMVVGRSVEVTRVLVALLAVVVFGGGDGNDCSESEGFHLNCS